MTKAEFQVLLVASSFMAVRFGQQFVLQNLPFDFRYKVCLNQSYDGRSVNEDVLFPEDKDRIVDCNSELEVVKLLYRDGRCPQWIDVSVARVGDTFTELRLVCCGRFTDDRNQLYYVHCGTGPFGIKSPDLPPGNKDGEKFLLPNANCPI